MGFGYYIGGVICVFDVVEYRETVVYVGELLDSGCLELIHIWVVRAINGLGWGNNGWVR